MCAGGGGCAWTHSWTSESLPPHSPPRLPSHRNFVITSSLGLNQTQHSTTLGNLFVWSSPWRHRSWGREGGRGANCRELRGVSSESSFNSGTENKMPFPRPPEPALPYINGAQSQKPRRSLVQPPWVNWAQKGTVTSLMSHSRRKICWR